MKNVFRIAAGAAALCCIFAFASCAQPASKDSGNNSGLQQGNGGGTHQSGGNGGSSHQGSGNNSGGNGSQHGGENQPTTYTVYLKNKSDYAVTFWYVKNVDDEEDYYASRTRIEAGNTGYITGIPGGKTYEYNSQLENGDIRYSNPFYLDDDFVITIH
ncbi:MAG: hypothetical protein ACTTKL_09060 [Treponema sp.]